MPEQIPATPPRARRKLRILFLCTGNSCRSQMAEGWANNLLGDKLEAHSAGIEAHGLNEHAVRVMDEVGINITEQRSKELKDVLYPVAGLAREFDYVVTVCQEAHESCPRFPARARVVHQGFDDPPLLARNAATEETALGIYRRVRDEIRDYVQTLPDSLPGYLAWLESETS